MSRSRKQNLRGAFTLLELIIALAMSAVIIVSLVTSLRIAFRASDSAEAAVEPGNTGEIAMDYLRSDLASAQQPGTNADLVGTFEGTQVQDDRGHEADDLIFFSTADSPQHENANSEIRQIELTMAVVPSSTDHVLVRRVTRNLLSETQANPDEEVLCHKVSAFTLQYYDGSNWNPTWDSTVEDNTIPAAVRVVLDLERAGPQGTTQIVRFERVIPLPCSSAQFDDAVNGGTSVQ